MLELNRININLSICHAESQSPIPLVLSLSTNSTLSVSPLFGHLSLHSLPYKYRYWFGIYYCIVIPCPCALLRSA